VPFLAPRSERPQDGELAERQAQTSELERRAAAIEEAAKVARRE